MSLLSELVQLRDAIQSGDVAAIWGQIKVLGDLAVGPAPMHAAGGEAAKCEVVAAEIVGLCETPAPKAGPPTPKGKIGDGTILKLLLPLILQLLPLFVKTPDPTPAA